MAKKIVGIFRPFELEQKIHVYDAGNLIGSLTVEIEKVPQTLLQLTELHSIEQIDFVGPQQYVQGLRDILKNLEMTKYQKNTITVNLI